VNQGEKITIHIISPFQLFAEVVTAFLNDVSGFEIWNELSPDKQLNIVLLDCTKTKQDFSEIIETQRKQYPNAKVLLLLWEWAPHQIQAALQAGASGCLDHQITLKGFIALIRQAFRGSTVLSSELQRSFLLETLKESVLPAEHELDSLSAREQEVLELICKGKSNKEVAQTLYLSVRTIENHLRRIYKKLGVKSRTEAAIISLKEGWFGLN
jgi:DNA-binding NarL/FixJ family response regulator